MNVPLVSNVLETISFFMVTVDLYGRDRLEALSKRLRARIDSVDHDIFIIFSRIMKSDAGRFIRDGFKYLLVISLVVLTLSLLFAVIYPASPIRFAFIGTLLVGLLFAFALLPTLVVLFVRIFISIIALLAARLARSRGADGLLLAVGALIFLVSKFLAIYATMQGPDLLPLLPSIPHRLPS